MDREDVLAGLIAEKAAIRAERAADERAKQYTNGHDAHYDGQPRIRLIPFDEITLGTERRDTVKGLTPREGMVVVWGEPKCGKSFWTFDLVMHIAAGWEYRGRRVEKGAVVYCAFEGQQGIRARVEAFRLRFNPEAGLPFFLQPATLDLVADHVALIEAISANCRPSVVVLDTLNRSLRGSENSDEDMSAYVRAADSIREAFKCAVIIIHHCGIAATRPRGHTSLSGAVDVQIKIQRDPSETIIATIELAKDGPQGDEIASRLEVVNVGQDEDGETISSCVIVPGDVDVQAKAKVRVTGAAKIALDILVRVVAETGEITTGNINIPSQTRTVPFVRWRAYCDNGMVAKTDSPDSKRKAFVRAVETLQAKKCIGIWGSYVWLAQ